LARAAAPAASPGPGLRPLVRAWAVFLAVLVGFQLAVEASGPGLRELATRATAELTAGVLWGLGSEGQAFGSVVRSSVFSAEIIFECTAALPIAMWIAAVLAHPWASWRARGLGLALGVPALVLLNLIRLVSLFYLGHWWPEAFETAHLLVWQALMVFLTLLLWLLWAATLARSDDARSA